MADLPHPGDLLAAGLSLLLLCGYHLMMRRRERQSPGHALSTWLGRRREAWVERMIGEQQGILAVQTLRNQMMVGTFFASTAVLLIIGVLTLTSHSSDLAVLWSNLSLVGPMQPRVFQVKLLLMLVNLIAAFAAFSQNLRLLSHVSFLVSAGPRPDAGTDIGPIARLYRRAGGWQTIGMRHYYFAVPLLLWLFDPVLLVLSTATLVVFLYHSQRAPR